MMRNGVNERRKGEETQSLWDTAINLYSYLLRQLDLDFIHPSARTVRVKSVNSMVNDIKEGTYKWIITNI